jgi:uncharacterized protein (TIGR00251 family)
MIVVKVIPGASQNEVVGWEGDVLKVRIKAPPDKGKANVELVRFLAEHFGVSQSAVTIVSGHTSRLKRIQIEKDY